MAELRPAGAVFCGGVEAVPHNTGRAASVDARSGVACAAAGRVREIAGELEDGSFIGRCVERYRAAGFGEPGEAEVRAWRRSWPPLLKALVRAGLQDVQVYLEYGTPGGSRRLDALLVGSRSGGELVLVVVELKQWHRCRILDRERVMLGDGQVTVHPVFQVASYRSFFQHWRPATAPRLNVRAVVVLHNATIAEARVLRPGVPAVADIPVLSGEELSLPAETLLGLLRCADVLAPSNRDIAAFEGIQWTPSTRLLDQVGSVLEGSFAFALVGDQQDAFIRIRAAATRHLPAVAAAGADQAPDGQGEAMSGAVVTVSGGPGSGKTALAVRLLGHLMRAHPAARPRFLTPSGTLRAHLLDAARGHSAARELFPPAGSLRSTARQAGALVIDEAQRIKRGGGQGLPADLAAVLEHVPLAVIFLDERQIIRPDEGTTVEEIRAAAHRLGRVHHHLELTGSFRCSGSAAYTGWVDALLYGTPVPWTGHAGYELGLADDPFQLQEWIEQATAAGHTARTTAGFCWPWTRTRPRGATALPLDIQIDVGTTDTAPARTWRAAWNAASALTDPHGTPLAPHSQLWASHTGGHQQVGCIYTAQGLEYHHAGVIIGPDLTWRNNRWHAHPEQSRDKDLRHLTPEQYLPYALNIYRVLLTRGTHTTRIHATDSATHQMLQELIRED
ncbi:DNA/RNA helicase domain-containing protein [Streptomyces sp. NPDC048192]|uniref:DNA/RNA helicase domain-containing protein n=1 Tax=Streptomyces sp. NPDC048192 TaxID=3365510 RepID=UPI00371B93AA